MGNYAEVSDVQAEFKSIVFSGSSAVTSASVSNFIDQAEAKINAQIGTVYITPVTGSNSVLIMQQATVQLVKARIIDIIQVRPGNKDLDQGNPSKELRDEVETLIKDLKNKLFVLVDAVLIRSSGGVSSFNSANSVDANGASTDQVFQKGLRQW